MHRRANFTYNHTLSDSEPKSLTWHAMNLSHFAETNAVVSRVRLYVCVPPTKTETNDPLDMMFKVRTGVLSYLTQDGQVPHEPRLMYHKETEITSSSKISWRLVADIDHMKLHDQGLVPGTISTPGGTYRDEQVRFSFTTSRMEALWKGNHTYKTIPCRVVFDYLVPLLDEMAPTLLQGHSDGALSPVVGAVDNVLMMVKTLAVAILRSQARNWMSMVGMSLREQRRKALESAVADTESEGEADVTPLNESESMEGEKKCSPSSLDSSPLKIILAGLAGEPSTLGQ